MENLPINPDEGVWYDTKEEMVAALRAELDSLERRKAYILELLAAATDE